MKDYKTTDVLVSYLTRRIKELYKHKDELGPREKSKYDKFDLAINELEFIQEWLLEIWAKNEF